MITEFQIRLTLGGNYFLFRETEERAQKYEATVADLELQLKEAFKTIRVLEKKQEAQEVNSLPKELAKLDSIDESEANSVNSEKHD